MLDLDGWSSIERAKSFLPDFNSFSIRSTEDRSRYRVPITMVGLDVHAAVLVEAPQLKELSRIDTPLGRLVLDWLGITASCIADHDIRAMHGSASMRSHRPDY